MTAIPAKRRILIGPVTRNPSESVGVVNESLACGLVGEFAFGLHLATRKMGLDRQGGMNLLNLAYFLKHLATWIAGLCRTRPEIAHYAITSHWNMEKSLIMLGLAKRAGAKTIGHLHGGGFIEFWRSLPASRKVRALRKLRKLDGFVTLSEGWRTAVIREIGIAAEKVHVVHNPIDSEFEYNVLGFPPGRGGVNVLCFGVMDRKKGVLDIIESVAQLSLGCEVRYQLVGPEREPGIKAEVEKRIIERGLEASVTILGPVYGKRKVELFRNATLLLLPSYIENFPVSVIEAAAAGLPVVATRVGAIPEFFENEVSALFVDTGNVDQIASAVSRLLKDGELRSRLARNARNVFEQSLMRERVMEQMAAVYHTILKENTQAGVTQ
jgi:glycosyltransferase involved in cell wall biosynthesis